MTEWAVIADDYEYMTPRDRLIAEGKLPAPVLTAGTRGWENGAPVAVRSLSPSTVQLHELSLQLYMLQERVNHLESWVQKLLNPGGPDA